MKSVSFYIFALMAGSVIFIGLPLLGWGISDIPEFFVSPARLSYMVIMVLLQTFSVFYNPQAGRSNQQNKSGIERHKVDLVLIQIFSLAAVLLAPFSDARSMGVFHYGEVVRLLGFLVLIPGFILMQVSEKYLDRQFSVEVTVQEDHELIRHGPYTYIRHPRYLGILSFFTGISIIFRSSLGVFIVMALAAVLIWRVYREEALMAREFGEEWKSYCRRSWRLVPFLF